MQQTQDIILVVDYHAENIEFRWFNEATGEERTGKYATTRDGILRQVEQAKREVAPGGRVVWIMESTTGWARVKSLIGTRARFVLANVLQMPLPPKARRRKTDKIDTGRLLREYLHGDLPQSFQPTAWWREVRRVVDCRQDLAERQTAVKNWINSLLQHETWEDRENLWSGKGRRRLDRLGLSASDRALLELKLQQLDQLAAQEVEVEKRMQAIYDVWPEAQWVDQVRGVGMVTAVSALAHVGPIERFATAEDLISYAGLAPGVHQSDGTRRDGRIGGGGTDSHLRYMVIEASVWLRDIPRYRPTYERVMKKRGKKIARIVVARLFLRSLHKMLKDRVQFNPARSERMKTATATATAGCSG
ncbi:MAG: IS110 family transposase [Planctomycetota bacterium]|nr:IS110 family transposase [Planctomycetota bacterium]